MQNARNWPNPRYYRNSFIIEFSIYVSLIILILMGITGYIVTDKFVTTVTFDTVEKLLVQARSYSGTAGKLIIAANGPDELLLNNICKKLENDNPYIYWSGITNQENTFIAHTNLNQVVTAGKLEQIKGDRFLRILHENEAVELVGDTIKVSVPIKENNVKVGRLSLAASTEQIKQARRDSIVAIASITIGVFLIGIPVTVTVLRRKLRPIKIISENLKRVSLKDINIRIPFKSRNEFGYLSETLEVMGERLNDAQKELIEKERISRELEIAREIQMSILPSGFPKWKTFEFAGHYSSALEVGGDYFDFIDYGDKNLAFLVADVSGKSLPGMLVMLITRDIVRQLSSSIKSPDELLSRVNLEVKENIKKGMFVTMFYGLLNKETGEFSFASAGHNPLLVLDSVSGEIESFKTRGFPLGLMPDRQFRDRIELGRLKLNPGDWLVQYTDGINEAVNEIGEDYGMGRLYETLKANKYMEPENLIENTITHHRQFVGDALQNDDITLLVMKWNGLFSDNKYRSLLEVEDAN